MCIGRKWEKGEKEMRREYFFFDFFFPEIFFFANLLELFSPLNIFFASQKN
jgi:hypothetical protein